MTRRATPHDLQAERAVLGSVLLEPERLPSVAAILAPEQFYDQQHGRIFAAMVELHGHTTNLDLIALKEQLNGGNPNPVEGAYLTGLMDGIPDTRNVEQYAKIVKAKAARRRLAVAGERLTMEAEDGTHLPAVISDVRSEIDRMLATPESAEPLRIWAPDDLLAADIPEPESFLGTVFTRGEVSLIAGRRGVGKTYLALFMAQQIAMSRPFGHLVTNQARVLFLSQEMSETAIRKRIRRLFRPDDLSEVSKRLRILCKHRVKLDSDGGAQALARLIGQDRFDLVIIDALRDIKGGYKENSNDEMGILMVRLRDDVAGPCNACIVLLHHKGKPGENDTDRGGRGASALEDVPVDVIYLARKGKNPRRTINFEKTREDLEGAELWYEITSGQEPDSTEIVVGAGLPPEEAKERDAAKLAAHEEAIRKLADDIEGQLLKRGPLSQRQIAELVGARPASVHEALLGLEAQGVATWTKGTKGANLWQLAKGGEQ